MTSGHSLRQDDRSLVDATRRWILTPVALSVLLHVVLLSAVQGIEWVAPLEVERQLSRVYTIQTGTVQPKDLERIALAPEATAQDAFTAPSAPKLTPEMFPAKTDDGPREPAPEVLPTLRYPEEELPLISPSGLSDRSQAFLRDGDLAATELTEKAITYIPSGRTVGPKPSDIVTMQPDLREGRDAWGKAVAGGETPFLDAGTAPALVVRPPSGEAVTPDLGTTSLGREAEQLFGDDGTPVKMQPIPLNVKLDVYAEPGGAYRYFRLAVSEKEDLRLPTITKNVLFVIDVSSSMRLEMLRQVQSAVTEAAAGLNRGDHFNVVRFSEETFKTFEQFVKATPDNIRRAAASIRKEPGQVRTDVYAALRKVLAELPTAGEAAFRPTNIYLISDGNPTAGIQEIRKIVNDISEVTRTNYSVFAFNPGAPGANAYLLDLLAYRNRGAYLRAEATDVVGKRLLEMLTTYKDPVLMNQRAQYGNFEVDQVYPQTLPNLYAGRPMVIYGRCRPGDQIAVQIIGDSATHRRRFLYTSMLPDLLTDDKTIAQEWARGKIHHLTALIARDGENQETINEIRRLGQQYGLTTPYN